MVGKSMVFYFKYGRQLDQYWKLDDSDQKKAIKIGAPDLTDEQVDEKMEMIADVITKANTQAKEFFNELAQEADNILKHFCNTDIDPMKTVKSDWESHVYLFPKSYKKKKSDLLSVNFWIEDTGPEVDKSGYSQLEICITAEAEDEDNDRLYKTIKKIYKGKLETLCNWTEWGDFESVSSLLRVPIYSDETKDFQVEKEQLYNAILAPLKMLKQKDVDEILAVMYKTV